MGARGLPGCARLELAQGVVPLKPEEAVFEAMLAGWARQQQTRFLREDSTIAPRAALVRRLAEFTGQYPWEWQPAEAEAFVSHLRSGGAAGQGVDGARVRGRAADVLRLRDRWPV